MISANESDLLNDKSDDDGSDSGSAGTCTFTFRFEESVGCVESPISRVCGVGSSVFVPIGIDSIGDIVPLVVFVPIGVESKGGRLIEIFWRPRS